MREKESNLTRRVSWAERSPVSDVVPEAKHARNRSPYLVTEDYKRGATKPDPFPELFSKSYNNQSTIFTTPHNFNPLFSFKNSTIQTKAAMARGEANQIKVHYKGTDEDFLVFVDDAKAAKDWKSDKSIPLAQVVSSFKVFVTHK
jgi:hypothetical protein